MAPFYEGDRPLVSGERVRIGVGPRRVEIEVWGDNLALVTPPGDKRVYTGDIQLSKESFMPPRFRGHPIERKGRFVVERQSVSTHTRRPQIVWKRK